MFLDNLLDIAKDLSKYKNYSRQQIFTLCVDAKLDANIQRYLHNLSNFEFYLYNYTNTKRVKDKFVFDLKNLKKLIEIQDENWKNIKENQ